MNENRSLYVKALPLVFLAGLLLAGLQGYRDFLLKPENHGVVKFITILMYFFTQAVILIAVGVVFRQMKAAALALGAYLLLLAAIFFLNKNNTGTTSVLKYLQPFLFNEGVPLLLFGLICFKKQGLRYFLPLYLFSFAIPMLYAGSYYLDDSPYTGWFRLLKLYKLNELSYTFHIAVPMVMFLLTGECYAAASAHKRWWGVFHIDLSTNYTKAGAITLFIGLRLLINLLVIGLFAYPYAHFFDQNRFYFRGSFFDFLLAFTAGLALLIVIVLYYRRFLVEYFIANRKKIQWLFWIVNLPIIGLLVFPFVALTAKDQPRDRTLFFFTNAQYNLQPYNIMGVMLAISLFSSLLISIVSRDTGLFWFLWVVEVALFIWYVVSVTGYHVILGFALLGLIFFLSRLSVEGHGLSGFKQYIFADPDSYSLLFQHSIIHWFITAFQIVQYAVLLPVFHLNTIKTIQGNEENEKVSGD